MENAKGVHNESKFPPSEGPGFPDGAGTALAIVRCHHEKQPNLTRPSEFPRRVRQNWLDPAVVDRNSGALTARPVFDPWLHMTGRFAGYHFPNPMPPPAMNFHVSCELDYTLQDPATFLFDLRCLQTGGQKILNESLVIHPFVQADEFTIPAGMNRISRIRTLNPGTIKIFYQADGSTQLRIAPVSSMEIEGPANLLPDAIPFLFPSRYCQSDRLRQQAMEFFGHLTTPHAIASGVSDWIFDNVAYVSGSSGETSSAIDTLQTRQGVCRDFAHLAIALCRALNVPARYASCYAFRLEPPDFHACFEVFIDGWWYVFDATRLAPLNGLVRIAAGRDAADAAVCTLFGNPELTASIVRCDCTDADFVPVTRDSLVERGEAIALS